MAFHSDINHFMVGEHIIAWYKGFVNFLWTLFVTGPGKTGLIYTKYTCLNYGTYLLFCVRYLKSINFIAFLMDLCIYDDILDTILITDKKLLHFKLSKSGQILHVDKTCFPRPGHILYFCEQLEISIWQHWPFRSPVKEKGKQGRMKGLTRAQWINFNRNNRSVLASWYSVLWEKNWPNSPTASGSYGREGGRQTKYGGISKFQNFSTG